LPSPGTYIYEEDSVGFWLINADGTNQRKVLPYTLTTPAWSPDGDWIAFSQGAQIFKMPFDGNRFDITAIEQLTFEGRNFFPTWSPNGKLIAYNESICNDIKACGVWIKNIDYGTEKFIGTYRNFPNRHPFNDSLIYL
jgi:Tol biopolymer transport system component